MALLATQQIAEPGSEVTYSAAAGGGDTITPDPDNRIFLHVKNGSGGDITVTRVVPGTTYGVANPDLPTTVTAGEERMIPLYSKIAGSDGLISVTYSGVTSLTVAVVRV